MKEESIQAAAIIIVLIVAFPTIAGSLFESILLGIMLGLGTAFLAGTILLLFLFTRSTP